jgi:RNA polymerase sigma factor (sigma-70 family)
MLYRKHSAKLRGYFVSRGIIFADAQDLVHEVFQELGRGRIPDDPHTYVYGIARNVLSKYYRRLSGERAGFVEYCRHAATGNEHSPEGTSSMGALEGHTVEEVERILRDAATRLAPAYRELAILRFSRGLSTKELASLSHCSEDAMRKRIQRLRAMLRESIQGRI